MKKTVFLLLTFFALFSCSKTSEINNDKPASATTSINSSSARNLSPNLIDPEEGKKWGEISCTINTKIKTACNIIGSTCKKHDCDAARISITEPLSYKQIIDYAVQYTNEQIAKGFIDRENATTTIEIM